MAKYYGTYTCGHEGTTNIAGPIKDREWKKEKHFSKLCFECHKKQQFEKAEKEAKKQKLIELKGSEKQVKWAITLRNELEQDFDKAIAFANKYEKHLQEDDYTASDLKKYKEEAMKIEKASFFIENRKTSIKRIIKSLIRNYQ